MKINIKKEKNMEKPELLAPAGSFEKAKIAFKYGADAVYCGTGALSLRSRAEVDDEDLANTIKYAHSIGKEFMQQLTYMHKIICMMKLLIKSEF